MALPKLHILFVKVEKIPHLNTGMSVFWAEVQLGPVYMSKKKRHFWQGWQYVPVRSEFENNVLWNKIVPYQRNVPQLKFFTYRTFDL